MILVVDHLAFGGCRVGAAARTRTGVDVHFDPVGIVAILEDFMGAVIDIFSLAACG